MMAYNALAFASEPLASEAKFVCDARLHRCMPRSRCPERGGLGLVIPRTSPTRCPWPKRSAVEHLADGGLACCRTLLEVADYPTEVFGRPGERGEQFLAARDFKKIDEQFSSHFIGFGAR